jgi:hypothetical protein
MLQLNFDDATRYYSNDALNTPTRRHRGSVIQFGTITRQLSDRTSPYKVADCQVDVDDSDRHLSILEATAASEHWQNREAKVTVQNLDSLAAGETPHTLGRFIWRKHLSSGLQRTIGLTDVLGSEFSDFNLERSLPTRQIKDDFPGAPEDSLERYVPIAMGVFPDRSGASLDASPVTGVTVTPTARAAAPTNFTLTPTAGGNFQAGNDEFYLLGAIVGGVMSDLAGPVSFTTDDVNKSAQLNWDAYPGASALVLFSAVKSHFLQFAKVLLAGGATSYLDTYVMPNQDPEWRSPNSPWFLDYRINVTWYVEALLSDGTYSEPGVSSVLVIAPISAGIRHLQHASLVDGPCLGGRLPPHAVRESLQLRRGTVRSAGERPRHAALVSRLRELDVCHSAGILRGRGRHRAPDCRHAHEQRGHSADSHRDHHRQRHHLPGRSALWPCDPRH